MRAARSCLAFILAAGTACASSGRLFPLRDPLWRDGDLDSVRARCTPDPSSDRASCTPREYETALIWDGLDNSVFRPLSETLSLDLPGAEAIDVNSMDEVPDSAWFTNRHRDHPLTVDELVRAACPPTLLLDGDAAPDASWVIDKGKVEGSTPGFRVRAGNSRYLFKADDPSQPELASAAQTIGLAIYHAAGFNTPCEQIVYFKPSVLKLKPNLYSDYNLSEKKPFDEASLRSVLARCPSRDGRVRMQASAWVAGHVLGPFRYEGTRADDPNDVVDHRDRRELRGSRLIAAWIDRVDAREGNSLDTWIADRAEQPESSPGHVVHYILDTSDALGPGWTGFEPMTRRAGYSYMLDWGDLGKDWVGLGIPLHPWDYVQATPGYEIFRYFNVRDFVPDEWRMEYPNPAFSRMTERDAAWMARILARFTPGMVRALAEMGRFSDPRTTDYLEVLLEGRLERILDRYLTRLSPIADVRVEGGSRLCGVDLAEWRKVRAAHSFHFIAHSSRGAASDVEPGPDGSICVRLAHFAADGGPPDDAPSRYAIVTIRDGVAPAPLRAHLYDLGSSRGYRLVGIERSAE